MAKSPCGPTGCKNLELRAEIRGALFGKAAGGDGVELVGLLVSAWVDADYELLPEIEARCRLLVPATRLFD